MNDLRHEINTVHAQTLQTAYVRMMGGASLGDHAEVIWNDIDSIWQVAPEFTLTQGEVGGRFTHESVALYLGGLPGYTIMVDVVTDEGDTETVELKLDGDQPQFRIEPAKPHSQAML